MRLFGSICIATIALSAAACQEQYPQQRQRRQLEPRVDQSAGRRDAPMPEPMPPRARVPAHEPPPNARGTASVTRRITDLSADLAHQLLRDLLPERKTRLAVVPLADETRGVSNIRRTLEERLTNELYEDHRVVLIEKSQIDAVLAEMRIQERERAQMDQRTVQALGKRLGANTLVVGAITDGQSDLVINCRMVEVETNLVIGRGSGELSKVGLNLSSQAGWGRFGREPGDVTRFVLIAPFDNPTHTRAMSPASTSTGGLASRVDRYSIGPQELVRSGLSGRGSLRFIDTDTDGSRFDAVGTANWIVDDRAAAAVANRVGADRVILGRFTDIVASDHASDAYGRFTHLAVVTARVRVRVLDADGREVFARDFAGSHTDEAQRMRGPADADVARRVLADVFAKVVKDKAFRAAVAGA